VVGSEGKERSEGGRRTPGKTLGTVKVRDCCKRLASKVQKRKSTGQGPSKEEGEGKNSLVLKKGGKKEWGRLQEERVAISREKKRITVRENHFRGGL